MKLYDGVGPNPRIVRMFLAEKGVELATETIDVGRGAHRSPPFRDLNPMMQVPALETDAGAGLSEATVICEYLEELHPDPPLIGADAAQRAETRMWMRRLDLNVMAGRAYVGRAIGARDFYKDKMRLLSVEAAREVLALTDDAVIWLDSQMAGRTWICGDRYSLADILAYCLLSYPGEPGGARFPPACASLPAWFDRVGARPAARA